MLIARQFLMPLSRRFPPASSASGIILLDRWKTKCSCQLISGLWMRIIDYSIVKLSPENLLRITPAPLNLAKAFALRYGERTLTFKASMA